MRTTRRRAALVMVVAGFAASMATMVGAGTAAAQDHFDSALRADFSTKQPFPAVYPGHYPEWARMFDLHDFGFERSGVAAVYLSRQQSSEFAAGGGLPLAIFAGAAELGVWNADPMELRALVGEFPGSCFGIVFTPGQRTLLGYNAVAWQLGAGECPGD